MVVWGSGRAAVLSQDCEVPWCSGKQQRRAEGMQGSGWAAAQSMRHAAFWLSGSTEQGMCSGVGLHPWSITSLEACSGRGQCLDGSVGDAADSHVHLDPGIPNSVLGHVFQLPVTNLSLIAFDSITSFNISIYSGKRDSSKRYQQ